MGSGGPERRKSLLHQAPTMPTKIRRSVNTSQTYPSTLHVIAQNFISTPLALTVCVSRWWAGWDSLREQKKLEARKMSESRDESHQSAARFVGQQCS